MFNRCLSNRLWELKIIASDVVLIGTLNVLGCFTLGDIIYCDNKTTTAIDYDPLDADAEPWLNLFVVHFKRRVYFQILNGLARIQDAVYCLF